MRARAPGKVVLSGAYAVLEGAPAIAFAVPRFAVVDTAQACGHVGEEILSAVRLGIIARAPLVDVSALRASGAAHKLGLGSSAAALVAAVRAHHPHASPAEVFSLSAEAHAAAQPGGSGIDVAVSTYGGVIRFSRSTPAAIQEATLPDDLALELFFAQESASTQDAIGLYRAAASKPAVQEVMAALTRSAEQAANATHDADRVLDALRDQTLHLSGLGDLIGFPVQPAWLRAASEAAAQGGGVLFSAGAGGGDVVVAGWSRRRSRPAVEVLCPRLQPLGISWPFLARVEGASILS